MTPCCLILIGLTLFAVASGIGLISAAILSGRFSRQEEQMELEHDKESES